MKELIVDYLPFEVTPEQINESISRNGKLVVHGVLQRANAKNQNGRVYPREILERESQKYTKEFVVHKRELGELTILIVLLLTYRMYLIMLRK